MAEIFGVTSDEILRGERAGEKKDCEEKQKEKNEKQLQRLLEAKENKAWMYAVISDTVGVFGLIVALLCNSGFNRPFLGFYIGCIFYLGGIITEVIATKFFFSSLKADEYECDRLLMTRKCIYNRFIGSVIFNICLFSSSLSLVVVGSPKWGIDFFEILTYGLFFAGIALVICLIVNHVITRKLKKRGAIAKCEHEDEIRSEMRGFNKKLIISSTIAFLVATAAFIVVNAVPDSAYYKFTEIRSMEELIAFFEENKDKIYESDREAFEYDYFSEEGEEELWNLENQFMFYDQIFYTRSDSGDLIIHICSDLEMSKGHDREFASEVISGVAMGAILIGAFAGYFVKKKKVTREILEKHSANLIV